MIAAIADDDDEYQHTVMQERCIYCKRIQYTARVVAISHGDMGCFFCDRVPPVFYLQSAYEEALGVHY